MELGTTTLGYSQGNQSCHQDTVVNHFDSMALREAHGRVVDARRSSCSVLFGNILICGRFLSNGLDRKAHLEM